MAVVNLNRVDLRNNYLNNPSYLIVVSALSSGGTASCLQPGISIQINQRSKSGLLYSHFSFWISQEVVPGKIRLKDFEDCPPFVAFFTTEGDANTGYFSLVEKATNELIIDSYNKETGELAGRFTCKFVPKGVNRYSFLNKLDTLAFTDGYFKTIVQKAR